jgi:hypothetical protein
MGSFAIWQDNSGTFMCGLSTVFGTPGMDAVPFVGSYPNTCNAAWCNNAISYSSKEVQLARRSS